MQKKKLRILFNDAHSNLPWQNQIPQGGPSRFARVFSNYFMKDKDVELISLLFSHNEENQKIYWRKRRLDRDYYEIVYPREKITTVYKKNYTKKDYLIFLKPWLEELEEVITDAKPDVVFLNGFNLSNWMFMEAAYRGKIPVVIQHAGIWKRELSVSQDHFSGSTRRVFASFEKDIVKKSTHQIFLNEFSRNIFIKDHNIKDKKILINRSSIIPLPIEFNKIKEINFSIKDILKIGIVARWDSIKNHSAILRLSKHLQNFGAPFEVNVVTKLNDVSSKFKDEYKKNVNIIPPMDIVSLNKFIDRQDLILVPSKFDVSPTIFLEGLVRGKLVLVSTGTGWSDLFKKFGLQNLLFSPSASGELLYSKIDLLKRNKEKIIEKFKDLQQFVLEEINTSKIFENYKSIFIRKIHD